MALTTVFHKGVVTAPERAANGHGTPDFGVYGVDDFKVGAHPSIPFAVLVRAGRSHRYGVTSTAAIDQVVQCDTLSAPSSNTRWDLIVVRDDWSTGTSVLAFITAGTSPVIPGTLANNPGVLVEQPLALVRWQGGTSAPVEFIDLRCWAANGGIIAAHTLALKYLARPGAAVQINGVVYHFQPIGNGAWDWVREPDMPLVIPATSPLAGSVSGLAVAFASGTKRPIFLADSVVVTTDAAGNAAVTFSTPFPNGVLGVQPSNGDSNVGKSLVVSRSGFFTSTTSAFYVSVAKGDGSLHANKPVRIDYIAIGF